MATLQTRIATLTDLDATASLFDAYRQFYAMPPDLSLAQHFIGDRIRNQESVILLAENEAQQVVGFCQLYPTFCSVEAQPIYMLYDLFVIPEARRLGVGKALLQAAERLAAQNGKVRLDLSTAKTNTTAQAVYESLGWVRDEVFHVYTKAIVAGSE